MTAAYNNIVLGFQAGENLDGATVSSNILLGYRAGQGVAGGTSVSNNIFLGRYAGRNVTNDASNNVSIGRQSGMCVTSSCSNTFIGNYAGCRVTTGCNLYIGHKSGNGGGSNITGTHNIAIGYNANVPDITGNTQFVIGCCTCNWIVGNSNFNVGIGTTNPKTDFQVGSHYGVTGGIGTFTAAAGVAHTINEYTIASTDFKTAEYTIFAGLGTNIQSQKLLVMQDGSTAYSEEYAVMSNNTQILSASATLASGIVKIEVTPETGISGLTTFRFTRHTML
jgi:hypothetical protein